MLCKMQGGNDHKSLIKLHDKRISYACTNALVTGQVQDSNLPIHDTITSQSLPLS